MSPENQGVFLVPERGDFSKNSGILQLTKMWLFTDGQQVSCVVELTLFSFISKLYNHSYTCCDWKDTK